MRDPLSAPDNASITIVGIGSPWGDDRVGWCVADALAARLNASTARVLKLDRPGAALLPEIAGRRHVVLVDAAVTGAGAGTLRCIALDELPSTAAVSSHGFGLAETLKLAQSLGELPAALWLYVVSIDAEAAVRPEADLTPAVAAAVAPLTDAICRRLATLGTPDSSGTWGRGL